MRAVAYCGKEFRVDGGTVQVNKHPPKFDSLNVGVYARIGSRLSNLVAKSNVLTPLRMRAQMWQLTMVTQWTIAESAQ